MAVSALTAFWAVSLLLVMVPGADWAYVIAAGLRDRSVVPAVGGLLAGYVLLTAEERGGDPWTRRAMKGAGISGLNPKALLLFLALLPQFASCTAAWPFAAQIAVLGLVHAANCGVVYLGVGTAARRMLRARPTVTAAVTRGSGVAMIAIGVFLLVERLLG